MEKPDTTEKTILKIWQMLDGVDNDGLYHEFKHLMKYVKEFISNTGNVRHDSCPLKIQFENHLIEHKKNELVIKDNKEFKLKKWQVAFAGFGVCVAIAIGVLNLIL